MRSGLPAAILLLAALGGCRTVAETDPSAALRVRAGERFSVVLRENPTTGYEWRLLAEPDPALIEPVGREYAADQPVAIGSGGKVEWTFRALAPGDAVLVFGHFPPGGEAPYSERTFQVQIHP